jgi:hypothetical protein
MLAEFLNCFGGWLITSRKVDPLKQAMFARRGHEQ